MTKVPFSDPELDDLLKEQLEFLKASADSFDAGFEGEIKRLAVSVRVMVHDTPNSTSLLTLTRRKTCLFLDSSTPYDDQNQIGHSSLVQIHFSVSGSKPKAHLDSHVFNRNVNFEDWWNGIVLVDMNKVEYSRKDIVLSLANKEGGAHVDSKLDAQYVDLRKNNALGWVESFSDGRVVPGADHVPATMRQIAHELIKTFDPLYAHKQEPMPGTSIVIQGMSITRGTGPSEPMSINLRKDRPIVNGKKVGRNDPCPCGSEKKYKKCCLK